MQTRLTAVEEKIAHLERHLGELDEVVRGLYDRSDGFRRQLDAMRATVQSLNAPRGEAAAEGSDGSDQSLKEQRPPHW